jgi:hypothetical protein
MGAKGAGPRAILDEASREGFAASDLKGIKTAGGERVERGHDHGRWACERSLIARYATLEGEGYRTTTLTERT